MALTVLQISLIFYVGLALLMLFYIFNHKKSTPKFIFVNNVTGHVVSFLVLLSLVSEEYSLIDMSFIYILLGPLVGISILFAKKYMLPDPISSPDDNKSQNS